MKFVFDSGDDKFSDIAITKISPAGDRVRVRISATRDRTMPVRSPGGQLRTFHTTSTWSLLFVREAGDWKLLREGSAVDGLADSLLEAETAEQRDALLAGDQDLVTDELVSALARRATQAAQMQAYRESQAGFERMRELARRVGNKRLEGEALQNLANAYYFQRDLPAALAAYQARLDLERERGDAEGIAGSLLGIATIRYSFAEYGAALTAYRDALAIQENAGDEGAIAGTLISTGNVLYLQGDYAGAIADYTRSRDLNRKTNNPAGEANALEGMGRVFMAQGDYVAALDAVTGVLAEARVRNSADDQGTALLSLGDVHFRLGNFDSARTAFDEARRQFESAKRRAGEGRAWHALALTDLSFARFIMSEDEYRKSAAACGAAGDKECVATSTVGLAFAQTAQDKFKEGIASYTTAIDAFTALTRHEPAARARIGLSHALLGSGDAPAAATAAARAHADADALGNDDVLWRALVAEASALRQLRERAKAISLVQSAIAAVERLVAIARMRPSAPVPRDSSSAFALLALLQAEAGDAAAAFETVERMRVHDLRVTLAPVERDISRGMTDAERDEERTLAVDLVSLHAQVTRERGLPKPDGQRIAGLQKRIEDASAKRMAQQQRLFDRLPDLRVWRGHLTPADRAAIAGVLPDAKTLLVELVVGEDTLLALVAKNGEAGVKFTAHFEAASRRAIAERVARMTDPATLRDPAVWKIEAAALMPGLAAEFGGAARAIVIPHEVLWRVPFEALPAESGYLADTTSIIYASSVTALVNARELSSKKVRITALPDAVVAVGAPKFAPEVVERIAATSPGWAVRTSANAGEELHAVAAAVDQDRTLVIQEDDATEALVRERLRFADVIHLATPFRVNGGSPLFSPMLFAADASNDGTLEPREIMNLELEARLAVLSDGTALGMRDAADDTAAVAWAWQAAGVAAIVVPRWSTTAGASNELLAALYARLREGASPETALQTARARLRANPATAAPYAWAGWLFMSRQ